MQVLTYKKYLEMIPAETAKFVRKLLEYLDDNSSIRISSDKSIYWEEDKLLFKSLKAYKFSSEANRNVMSLVGFIDNTRFDCESLSDSSASKLFTKYYKAFTPFENEEDYLAITPEEIIRCIYINYKVNYQEFVTEECISSSMPDILKKLEEISISKKKERIAQLNKSYNDNFNISVINYYDTVGKLFYYLRERKNNLKNIDTSDDSLKHLAMFIAIFYYKHVTVYQEKYNEQRIITDFYTKKGITKENIEKIFGIEINETQLNKIDSTLVLNKYFKESIIKAKENEQYTVGYITRQFLNKGLDNSLYVKKILGLFNCTISSFSDLKKILDQSWEDMQSIPVGDFYNGFVPEVINFIKNVSQMYTYLLSKKESFDQSLITLDSSFFILAIIILSYDYKSNLNEFLVDKGVTLDKVLELFGLPNIDILKKEAASFTADEKAITKYSNIFFKGLNEGKIKNSITISSVVDNVGNRNLSGTSLLHFIYKTITHNDLDDNCTEQVKKFINNKDEKRKRELTEKMLENIPISTFEFLKILSSYYTILKSKILDEKDLEQISIIMAATRADKILESYMASLGITRTTLSSALEIEFSYAKKPFNIDIIRDHFMPYVFDRPNEEITIYSIFENAFKPELTNTLNLRRVLSKFEKEPEDFLGIEDKITIYQQEKTKKEKDNKIRELINRCDEATKKVVYDTLLIAEYLTNNLNELKLIKNADDIKAISIVISVLLNDTIYLPFFAHNGITLDTVLSNIGLTNEQLKSILKSPINRSLVLNYASYLDGEEVELKKIINRLFNPKVNPSNIIEVITSNLGKNYTYLVEEVTTMKEREPSPGEGISILSSEEVRRIDDPSFTSIADFGLSISKHSKYINNAINQLAITDTIDHSLDGINGILEEVTTEETIEQEKKPSFISRFFGSPRQIQVVRKYNPEKIDELQNQVDEQIRILSQELKGYELIKKYIELFLKKLYEHLEYLKEYYASFESEPVDDTLDEIERFTKTLDRNSGREILIDKINTFETMILLMKQELITVHRTIINHFIAINSLQTSKSAILPLLTTEIALLTGRESEKEAFELAGGLVKLFGSIVNGNAEETKANLERLRLSSISEETYASMSKEVNAYLESLGKSTTLLSSVSGEKKEEEQLVLKPRRFVAPFND